MRKSKIKISEIIKEYENANSYEIWEGCRDNFMWGFLGAIIVVFITTQIDSLVFLSYLMYYFFVGKIVNRPKYITNLGKLVVFPIPSAIGAFSGYKLSLYLTNLI